MPIQRALQVRSLVLASSLGDQERLYQDVAMLLRDEGRSPASKLPVLEVPFPFSGSHTSLQS